MPTQPSGAEECFLVLAPTGRDAALTCSLLGRSGMAAEACGDMRTLCAAWDEGGALGLMVAEEALNAAAIEMIKARLALQESWSDLPILIFRSGNAEQSVRPLTARALGELGYVTLLDRPLQQLTMLSAANAASRSRKRQYAARTALQAEQLAVKQRDQFLAMLGHELRNPLAAISLAAHAESEADLANAVVRRQVKHLTRLVDDLLDVSRVTSGKVVLQRSLLDLRGVAQRGLETVRSSLLNRQLEITVDLPSEPVHVHGDPVRLEQVVVNLLGNAAKYTPDGGHITLRVARRERDGANGTARGQEEASLTVRDDGVGLAKDMLPHVFELFAQAQGSLDRAQGGMGIGLTLVHNLIALHGGSVSAASDGLGRGSTFTARLPAARASQGALAAPSAMPAPPQPRSPAERSARNVLVVEDNDDSRELLSALLRRQGHRVSAAVDGFDGIDAAIRERPEVVLVDIGLPGLDGYAVAQRLRDSLGSALYLVALTGYGQPEDRLRAREAGFDVHLTKPVDMNVLQRLIGSLARNAEHAD